MTFLEAVVLISQKPEFELCANEDELNGLHHSICVYRNDEFIGKLRWPSVGNRVAYPASVDEFVVEALKGNA